MFLFHIQFLAQNENIDDEEPALSFENLCDSFLRLKQSIVIKGHPVLLSQQVSKNGERF